LILVQCRKTCAQQEYLVTIAEIEQNAEPCLGRSAHQIVVILDPLDIQAQFVTRNEGPALRAADIEIEDDVAAVTGRELEGIAARSAEQPVISGSTRDHIITPTAEDEVIAAATQDRVIAAPTTQEVIARTTIKEVLTPTAKADVIASAAQEQIVTPAPKTEIGAAAAALDIVDTMCREGIVERRNGRIALAED